ncbi:ABC transporter ATP-binding protein [Clostridium aciditolerans]|uniref:ABC transporter ATP-binding protein n=1 Tax=Clostridium aciditolerans TaxID=339861 RepID=A0A934HTE2_9CLOT|nr:ABC transporter ATP-binding protein [Clostridium aciditolerans]MBI6873980.1 ABC transporter ATP-binding protein [Clostridium aciditolerans]
MVILNLDKVCKVYGKEEGKVEGLNNIDLEIKKGEFIAIIGPSGSGKTTLLNILGTLDFPSSGQYLINGESVEEFNKCNLAKKRNKYFGFIVQNFALIKEYTVYENIEIPLNYANIKTRDRKAKIKNVLERLGLSDKVNKTPKELSGGQCQRVAIARAIINDPDIILADEPTGALDKDTAEQILELLRELNEDGKTIIMVTHNLDITRYCNRIIKLEYGKIVETI